MSGTWRDVFFNAVVLTTLLVIPACAREACPFENLPTTTLSINGHTLTVELATTPASLHCGLAFRDALPPDRGMLFVFAEDRPVQFWMKDTRIPLSIAFLDAEGAIVGLADMDPADPGRRYSSGAPVRYALETNRGWFAAQGIHPGDSAKFTLP